MGGNQGASVGFAEGATCFEVGSEKEVADGENPGSGVVVDSLKGGQKVVVGETVSRCCSSVAGFWTAVVQSPGLCGLLSLLKS